MYFVFFGSLNQQKTPSAADIKKTHTFFQMQFFQNIIYFIDLCLI